MRTFAGTLTTLLVFLASPSPAVADWLEVRSPHFRVLTNERERDARQVAFELERIRMVLNQAMAGAVSDPLRPVLVIAVKGEDDLVRFVPELEDGPEVAGIFRMGSFVHQIIVRVESGPETVYHEYFHLLTRRYLSRVPVWLAEGLAEFHSKIDPSGSQVKLGQPDFASLAYLDQERWSPLRALLAKTTDPHEDDRNALQLFYTQSWAVVHLLKLGYDDPSEGQQALDQYVALLLQGMDSVAAFEQAIGDVEEFDRRLREYVRQFSFKQFAMEMRQEIDRDSFLVREVSSAEALATQAMLLLEGGHQDLAKPLLEEADALDQTSPAVAEAMGLLHFSVDDSELADEWFAEAIERGSMSYIPFFLQGFSDSDSSTRIQHLRQATVHNPRFAPAYGELARLYADDLVFEEAMPLVRRASALDPDDARYQILTARVLLLMDQPRAARLVAQQALRAGFDVEEQQDLGALVDEIDEYVAARAEPVPDSAPPADPPRNTINRFLRAADQGDATAQYNLGDAYRRGEGVPEDDAEAVRWYRLAAEQGHARAQNSLALMYAEGKGVPQDYAEAVRWYRRAADQGHARAQNNLGVRYAEGEGVPQDYAEAVRWYRRAADQGHATAQNNLGEAYRHGEGVPEDDAEAIRWYRLAAEQGYAGAQNSLGVRYAEGEGVPQDYAEAVRWYRRAADQGHATAQNSLGVMYARGEGVPQNRVAAHMWLSLAAARSSGGEREWGLVALDNLAAQMTPDQIAEAERLAREWKPIDQR